MRSEAVTSGTGVQYNGYAHSFGGMGIQFILFVGIEVGVVLLLQRQSGVWKRLRAAPLSRGVLLGSRATSAALTSMFVLMVLFAFARVVFGVRIAGQHGRFPGRLRGVLADDRGLGIAHRGARQDSRGHPRPVHLHDPAHGDAGRRLGPTFVFPEWLQKLTVVIPTRWAMDGLDATTWRGLGFSAAALPIAALRVSPWYSARWRVMRFRWEAEG